MYAKAFVLLCMTVTCYAQRFGIFERCPTVSVKKNFEPAKYLGTWYEYAKYDNFFEIFGKCITATYSLSGIPDVINVRNSQVLNIRLGICNTISGKAKFTGPSNVASLSVMLGFVPVAAPYNVIETDYVNYAVVYSCRDNTLLNTSTGYLWILTRKPVPDPIHVNMAYDAMIANKIPIDMLTLTYQGCGCEKNCNFSF